jgi:thiol-disulfide isomerase/thioredoxin
MKNKTFILIGLILAGALIGAGLIYSSYASCPSGGAPKVSSEEAGDILVNFINKNILMGQGEAFLLSSVEEDGMYKIKFEVEEQEVDWYLSRDGLFIYPQIIDLRDIEEPEEPIEETGITIGNFSVSSEAVCEENGKPIIYYFGSESCPYCEWERPIITTVSSKFGDLVSFKDNTDNDEDMDIFSKYSNGGVPALVLGCKYYRVGAGQSSGAEAERDNLTALICSLTDNQPEDVCKEVEEMIQQI